MIEVKNLTKHFGSKKAVDDISFVANDNEVLGFLGPNGAGKSTTMNMLTGYISMTSGNILINGTDILKEPMAAKKKIGYLPEQPPLYPEMTVREYLEFVAELKGIKTKDKITEELISVSGKVGLDKVMLRRIGNLSKGYKQRTGFAAALIGDPEVLILDEPTVGLDPNQIIEIRELIKTLGKDHIVILSSHILSEISAVCGRVIIINDGRLVAEDTPQNLMKKSVKSSAKRVVIRVEGDKAKIERVLNSLLIPYSLLEDGRYELNISNAEQLESKDIFFAFANAKLAITEQHEEVVSLEDIFIELTKGRD